MGTPKALLRLPAPPLSSLPLVCHHLQCAESLQLTFSRVVLGFGASHILTELPTLQPSALINPTPERGQFSSLQWGLSNILHEYSTAPATESSTLQGIFVTPVDCPPVAPEVFHRLATAMETANRSPQSSLEAVIPTHGAQRGHPVLMSISFARQVLEAPPTSTLALELERAGRVALLEVPSPEILLNLNTPGDLQAYLSACQGIPDPSA